MSLTFSVNLINQRWPENTANERRVAMYDNIKQNKITRIIEKVFRDDGVVIVH